MEKYIKSFDGFLNEYSGRLSDDDLSDMCNNVNQDILHVKNDERGAWRFDGNKIVERINASGGIREVFSGEKKECFAFIRGIMHYYYKFDKSNR